MITQLGYLVLEVSDLAAWATFATKVLGLTVGATRPDGAFTLRLDDRAWRFLVTPGPADDVATVGFEVADAAALDTLAARLRATDVPATRDPDLAAARQVAGLLRFTDPSGLACEAYHGLATADPIDGFVAGDLGLGHIVVSAADTQQSLRFYRELLGFRLSDRITCSYYGHAVDITFLHCNPRHHTLAIGGRQPKRIHHVLVERADPNEVGRAWDRALRAKIPIIQTLGRHPNDHMFSFYGLTPSGFAFEYGHGGRLIDDATWEPTTYDRVSDWGHHPPAVVGARQGRP